ACSHPGSAAARSTAGTARSSWARTRRGTGRCSPASRRICPTPGPAEDGERRMSAPFVHLDVRSCFSLKEGACTPEQLASAAATLGMPAVAITDRDGLYGAARFVDACHREGVAPILGASLTVRASTPPPGDAHVVLLALDAAGYANLCRLLSDAHLLGERGDPWVAVEQICAHAGGLLALLGPRSHPGRLATAGRVDAAARAAAPFRDA